MEAEDPVAVEGSVAVEDSVEAEDSVVEEDDGDIWLKKVILLFLGWRILLFLGY